MGIKILCSTALYAAMPKILEVFARQSSETIDITYGTSVGLVEQCISHPHVDAVILTENGIEALLKHQLLIPASITPFAKTGLGMAVANDTEKFDISSKDALIQTLLQCESIAFTQFGASGMYFSKLIKTLGIEQEVLAKAMRPQGGLVSELVKNHQVQLAVQLVSEIKAVSGVHFLGFLPDELQEWSIFSIAQTNSPHSTKVQEFSELLSSAMISQHIQEHGFIN